MNLLRSKSIQLIVQICLKVTFWWLIAIYMLKSATQLMKLPVLCSVGMDTNIKLPVLCLVGMGTNIKLPVLCSVGMGTNKKLPVFCSVGICTNIKLPVLCSVGTGTNIKLPVLCSVGMGTNMKLLVLCSLGMVTNMKLLALCSVGMGTNIKLRVLCSVGMGTNMKLLVLSSLGGRQYSVTVYTSILILHLLNYFFELRLFHIDFRTNTCHTVTGAGWQTTAVTEERQTKHQTQQSCHEPCSWIFMRRFHWGRSGCFALHEEPPSSWGSIPKGEKGK